MSVSISMPTTSTNTFSHTLYIGYICSHCLNPMVKLITIKSKTEAYRVPAEELAQKAALNMATALEIMLSYLQNPTWELFPERKISTGLNRFISYAGWKTDCPVCGKIETWQDYSLLGEALVLSKPMLFPSLESAYEWARSVLENRKAEADKTLADPHKLNDVLRKENEITALIRSKQAELENGTAVQEVTALKIKQEQLSAELKAQGLFGKNRKVLQTSLSNCENALKAAEKNLKVECQRLKSEIAQAELSQKEYRLLHAHFADNGLLLTKEQSISLRLKEESETNDAGYPIYFRPFPQFVSFQISPFEENRNLSLQV